MMNKNQNELFDLINDNGYDMEDLIETINDKELIRLLEEWNETIEDDRNDL